MGLITDFLANATSIDTTPEITALDRTVVKELNAAISRGDPNLQPALEGTNEVQALAQYAVNHSGGTFALLVTLANGESVTTAAIAFGADAATIEAAIDTAANGNITGWVDGDISIAGGPLTAAAASVTYDGVSVSDTNQVLITLDGALLTGGTTASPATTITTEGQSARRAWGVLVVLGIIDISEVPAQGVDPGILTLVTAPGDNSYYPTAATIRALADEVGITDDSVAARDAVLRAAKLL